MLTPRAHGELSRCTTADGRINWHRYPHIVDQILSFHLDDGQGLITRAVSKTWLKTTDTRLCQHSTLTPLYERGIRPNTLIAPVTGALGLGVAVLRVIEEVQRGGSIGSIRVSCLPLSGACRLPLIQTLDMDALLDSEWIPEIVNTLPNIKTLRIKGRTSDTLSLSMPLDRLVLDGTPLLCPGVEEVGPRVSKMVVNIKGNERIPVHFNGSRHAPPAAVDELVLLLHPKPRNMQQANGWENDLAVWMVNAWTAHAGPNVPMPPHLHPFASPTDFREPAASWPRTVPLAISTLKAGGKVTIVNAAYHHYEDYFLYGPAPVQASAPRRVSSANNLNGLTVDHSALLAGMSHLAVGPGVQNGHANGIHVSHSRIPHVSLEDVINSQPIRRSSTTVMGEIRSISIDDYAHEVGIEELKFETYLDHV